MKRLLCLIGIHSDFELARMSDVEVNTFTLYWCARCGRVSA